MWKELSIVRADGLNRKIAGYAYDPKKNEGADLFTPSGKIANLPKRVDLRKLFSPVENRSNSNSCVANAVTSVYEYLMRRYLNVSDYTASRMFVYYNARMVSQELAQDSGCFIRDAIDSLKKFGACSERLWSFDKDKVNVKPSDAAYQEGANFLIENCAMVSLSLDTWKSCLAEGNPIIFSLKLFRSFETQKNLGLVSQPSPGEKASSQFAGHALVCVGYSEKDRLFIVRNSWGDNWGDGGYCYIPYDYVLSPEMNFGDCWVITQSQKLDNDISTWKDDSKSLLPQLGTEFASMSEEQFHKIVDVCGNLYPLEFRLGLVFLAAVGADNSISELELQQMAIYFQPLMKTLGSGVEVSKMLKRCSTELSNKQLVNKSIEILGDTLSKPMLTAVIRDIYQIASVDKLSAEEQRFIFHLLESWHVEDETAQEIQDKFYLGEENETFADYLKGLTDDDFGEIYQMLENESIAYLVGIVVSRAAILADADENIFDHIHDYVGDIIDSAHEDENVDKLYGLCRKDAESSDYAMDAVTLLSEGFDSDELEIIVEDIKILLGSFNTPSSSAFVKYLQKEWKL